MNCEEVQPLTHAYADRELDVVTSLEVERHLAECPNCSQACENIGSLKGRLKAGDLYRTAPLGLSRRVRSAIGAQAIPGPTSWWWHMPKLGISAAALGLVALVALMTLGRESADDRLAQEVTSSHVRSLMAAHLTDVASSDQHTVKPWFAGKLDFTPPVLDLAEHEFPLVGGRLDYLQGRPVAALIYRRHQHLINVFIWPAKNRATIPDQASSAQGYNLIHWTASGMTFWAVSDLNRTELREFVELLK